ncbi:MAG: threonylcarbamoyl-AMP synthase [Clostridia bacterium]|nr:threonylcarbamoyl-AMP synthase [Clostridia bacterium]
MDTRLLKPDPAGIDQAARLLQAGQLVAVPTETVYGLAADALNPTAVASIFAAKGRPMDNPLIVHIAAIEDWAPLVESIPTTARRLAEAYWPGPLTMILPAAPCIPQEVRGGLQTVAVRFPADPVAQAVILRTGRPLAAPSANRSGSPSPTNAARVMEDMQGRIAAILDGGRAEVGVESTVLDLSVQPPRLLRPGGITPKMIEEIIGPIAIDPAVTHALEKGAVAASPGMKYKHYAPKARIQLIKGSPAAYAHYVQAHAAHGVMALCFDEDIPTLSVPTVSYGSRQNPIQQAQNLFDALRQLDEKGATTVFAACPRPEGIGLAVYNRLIRAAGFDVVNAIRVVGLTGPTGAGKSTAAAAWREMGIPIIDTDLLAREIVQPGSPCLEELQKTFSCAILNPDGTLNRTALAEHAFSSPEKTKQLNAITHPAILALAQQKTDDAAEAGYSAIVVDAPLLFEAGIDAVCDDIVAVIAPEEKRIERIRARDGLSYEQAISRIHAQQTDDFYCRPGVTVLHNTGTQEELKQQAVTLWKNMEKGWWPTG